MIRATLSAALAWKGQVYEPGDREIPDDLAIALGLPTLAPSLNSGVSESHDPPGDRVVENTFVLGLINSAATPKDLIPLPGIGEGAAKRILVHRPDLGYESFQQLEQLCPELPKPPYRVDWGAVLAYSGDSDE